MAIIIPGQIEWDEAALYEVLNDPAGPVGVFIMYLDEKAVAVARSVVHVLPGTKRSGYWFPSSTAVRPPGTTKGTIRTHGPVIGSRGGLYGGGNAMYTGIFLEYDKPHTEQYYDRYPFLTTGLESLEAEFG